MADPSVSELLRREIEMLEAKLAHKRKILGLVIEDESEDNAGVVVTSGEFVGMDVAPAVERYLKKFNPARPAHIYDEVLPALIRGGCDLGTERDQKGHDRRPRTLMTTVRMRSKNSSHPFLFNDTDKMVRLRHPDAKAKSA